MLVEREVFRKDERRIEMALKIARFPMVRELADFDFKSSVSGFRAGCQFFDLYNFSSCGITVV